MTEYRLPELIDITVIRKMADAHYRATGIPIGIIDAFDDTVLAGSGWQDICVRFHRIHPLSRERCRESDSYIKSHLVPGEACHYRCKNGLRDIGIPLIVEGRHLATLFLGQFFYEDEIPEREFFIRQAEEFGFPPDDYLAALDRVPHFSRQRVNDILEYNKALAGVIADLGEGSLRKLRTEEQIRQRERKYHAIFNQSYQFIALLSPEGRVQKANETAHTFTGMGEAERSGAPLWEASCWNHSEEVRAELLHGVRRAAAGESIEFEISLNCVDASLRHMDFSLKPITDEDGAIVLLIAEGRDITKRKQAEQALQFTQFAIDHTRDFAYWSDSDGKFLYVNEASCRALGYTREEFLTMSIWDIRPEFPAERWPSHWQEVREEKTFSFETIHRRRDGSTFPVEITVNYVLFGGKEYNCAFARDMTERKRMEQQLRLIQFAFDHNFDACFWVNGQGGITAVNDAACRSLGYTREELLTMTVADIDPDWEWDSDTRAKRIAALRKSNTMVIESRHRRKDGQIFPVEICNNFVESEGEWFNCAFIRDITERKRMEDSLRLSNLVVENSPVVLFRWRATPEWPVEMVSRNVQQFGYSQEEFLSGALPYASIIFSEDLDRVTRETREFSSSGAPHFHLEYRIVTRDGQIRWVDERTVVERNGDGLIDFFQGVVIDINERRKMEEELVRAQKLESVGLLAGGIAHDFNNILTAILGNSSLARELLPPGERLHDQLNNIETAAFRAKDLTKQFLTFSKGGAPVRKPVNGAKLVKTYVQLSLSGLKSSCEMSIPDDLWNIEVDEGQISQVINNLIINADQAMPQGGMIRVECENVQMGSSNPYSLTEGAYISVSVTDQGMGIAPEHRSKIFDPYFTTKKEGRGLGLASAYAIMKKHAGHIAVESRVGAGSCFSFYLPAAPSATVQTEADTPRPQTGSGRVLVMDDEPVVRMVAGEMLEHLGYDVEFAQKGEEALAMYSAALSTGNPFDAVIMDLTIPGGMGGKEAIRRLREIDPHVRGIVSSGYSEDPVMADCTGYGFAGVVAKPYRMEELGAEVRRVMGSGRRAQE